MTVCVVVVLQKLENISLFDDHNGASRSVIGRFFEQRTQHNRQLSSLMGRVYQTTHPPPPRLEASNEPALIIADNFRANQVTLLAMYVSF